MKYRTDLAIESMEICKEAGEALGEIEGILVDKYTYDDDISATRIEVTNSHGEQAIGKPKGNYITLEVDGIIEERETIKERAARAFATELGRLIKFNYYLKVLVIGLGNEKVTPDSLGPHSLSKVKITTHLFKMFGCDGDNDYSNVSGIAPGVTATTGIETAELIKEITHMTKPNIVLIIDSLAAKNIDRVSTTIQISDTGISPGAGMGNQRKQLNEETLGVRVIAVGVPTVIDSKTLVIDALADSKFSEEEIDKYLERKNMDMIVTSTDIDLIIKDFSDIIANGINITLHPGIYS